MKKLPLPHFIKLQRLIHRSARPVDFTRWAYLFEDGSADAFLRVLSSYQNEDGGFGYNLECNNWNPNSSPYTLCIALDYLDTVEDYHSDTKTQILTGILTYLASGSYLLESGWVGMQGIPSNNDFPHLPWFHYDPKKASEADIGVTKRLCAFLLQYGEKSSPLCQRAAALQARYAPCPQTLLHGFPDYDPAAFDLLTFDPASYSLWQPLPAHLVGSPTSENYPALGEIVEKNLDAIVDALSNTDAFHIMPQEVLAAFEANNPHPQGKRWCTTEQAIGNYYGDAQCIISNLDLLRKFDRLDFPLPLQNQ